MRCHGARQSCGFWCTASTASRGVGRTDAPLPHYPDLEAVARGCATPTPTRSLRANWRFDSISKPHTVGKRVTGQWTPPTGPETCWPMPILTLERRGIFRMSPVAYRPCLGPRRGTIRTSVEPAWRGAALVGSRCPLCPPTRLSRLNGARFIADG